MMFSAKPQDFSARDHSIRINSYTTVRRRTALPHESFAAYWRDVHGPLCAPSGLGWYVQQHIRYVSAFRVSWVYLHPGRRSDDSRSSPKPCCRTDS